MKSIRMGWWAMIPLAALLVAGIPNSGRTAEQDTAQPSKHHRAPRARARNARPNRLQALTKQLSLTSDQQAKLQSVLKSQATQIRSLRQDKSLSRSERQAKLKSIRQEMQAGLEKVLTPDQLAKWKTLRRNSANAGKGRLQSVAKQLNLTSDQRTKLQSALKAQAAQMRSLRQDKSLSRSERRAKLKSVREELQASLAKVLTPEQLAKWKQMRTKRQPARTSRRRRARRAQQ